MTFEMKGVGPAVANAFRRILLSEVPTVAIEHVFVVNNTSVLQDEVLAHRLGLVPLGVDPRLLDFRAEGDAAGERNTVVLRLKLACRRGADGAPTHGRVTAADLEWLPEGSALPEESDVKLTRRAPQLQPPFRLSFRIERLVYTRAECASSLVTLIRSHPNPPQTHPKPQLLVQPRGAAAGRRRGGAARHLARQTASRAGDRAGGARGEGHGAGARQVVPSGHGLVRTLP